MVGRGVGAGLAAGSVGVEGRGATPVGLRAGLGFASVGYGVARWWIDGTREDEGRALLRELTRQPAWAAFGSIAAEADLAR